MSTPDAPNSRGTEAPRFYSDGPRVWYITTIWRAAEGLAVREVPITAVREMNEVCWFSDAWGKRPTCRAVVEHCRRIMDADFSHPIILGPDGGVLDGMHRIARALLDGKTTLPGVQLTAMPPVDELLSPDDPRASA